MRRLLGITIALLALTTTACWETANEGSVKVQTVYGEIKQIVKPAGGGIWTITTFGDDYYEVDLRSFTDQIDVGASTKDNAALNIRIAVTGRVVPTDENVAAYVRKFGLEPEERHKRRWQILSGQVNTETKNAIAQYDAYSLLANQEAIQKRIYETLKPIFTGQLLIELESVQIIGRPDFLNDEIENAASRVVANQKLKEASQAALEASKIDLERKQVEAQGYANPATLEIRKLELQREIAQAWAAHQGPLVLGNGSQVQMPLQK